jgi:hypothetical protein
MVSRVIAQRGEYAPVSGTVSARCREHGAARRADRAHSLPATRRLLKAVRCRLREPAGRFMISDLEVRANQLCLETRHASHTDRVGNQMLPHAARAPP